MDNQEGTATPTATTSLSITILPELESLLPELSPDEKSALRLSVGNEGVRDCLLVWHTVNDQGEEVRILVDGHNRYRISEGFGRDVEQLPVKGIDFVDIEEAKTWIITNQLMRRNLTDAQRSHFRGLAYEAAKKSQGGDRGNQHTKLAKGQNEPLAGNRGKSTAERLAERFNVSPSTIKRDAEYAKRVDVLPPEEKAAILRGDKTLPKVARARPSIPAIETAPEASQTHSEAIEFTPDMIQHINIEAPHKASYLVYAAIGRSLKYFTSLESITTSEHDSLVDGFRGLRMAFDGLIQKIGEIPVVDPVELSESVAASDSDHADTPDNSEALPFDVPGDGDF